ncbi:hypothetical protein QJS04_geneDACA015133 [Acorus gramineus]|uniref:Uncharacterized protein n=1 Tax=Acorus gramineus TaxID=55184 RepID=A0AAV9BUL6_ACOGR|nr:hypothetical protein QJS04_geneDACA015133 [Acorus gramineus]
MYQGSMKEIGIPYQILDTKLLEDLNANKQKTPNSEKFGILFSSVIISECFAVYAMQAI